MCYSWLSRTSPYCYKINLLRWHSVMFILLCKGNLLVQPDVQLLLPLKPSPICFGWSHGDRERQTGEVSIEELTPTHTTLNHSLNVWSHMNSKGFWERLQGTCRTGNVLQYLGNYQILSLNIQFYLHTSSQYVHDQFLINIRTQKKLHKS